VGTAHRQGARSVTQLDILPKPPETRRPSDLWPDYPQILRASSSHEEGGQREWSVQTTRFLGCDGRVNSLECVRVEWIQEPGKPRPAMHELPETGWTVKADLVLLAMGFVAPERQPLLDALGVRYDARGNVETDGHYMSAVPGVFAAGDSRRGQSLVVWAITEGRRAAHHIDTYLMGASELPLL
jgi:glutamate synthase (NADPH/NADH) small chain